jgi:cystathionine gamma-synthase
VLVPGDHFVAPRIVYWGLRKWLSEFVLSWGVDVTFVDATDLDAIRDAVRTRVVWIESARIRCGTSPDIAGAAAIAHEGHALLAVDSTVATPVHTRPLVFGPTWSAV